MGRASSRKRQRRAERLTEQQKLRVVVCAYPASSLRPTANLLKAATLYGDEVVLHHPIATMLASMASLSSASNAEFIAFVSAVAPNLGASGDAFARSISQLRSQHGDQVADAVLSGLLDQGSGLADLVALFDPSTAATLQDGQQRFAAGRTECSEIVEEQLAEAGAEVLVPAIDAGVLRLAPIEDRPEFFDAYIDALWNLLRDPAYYPLLDEGIADLVQAAVREGAVDLTTPNRARGRQATAAHQFLARLPTFPLASMAEVVDIRDDLRRPLIRFRSELVALSRRFTRDAFDLQFVEEAQDAWIERVEPALLELNELVDEKRLRAQFSAHVTNSGAAGSVGGLVTGLVTGQPLVGVTIAAAGSVASLGLQAIAGRRAIDKEVSRRPHYFLYKTEQLLEERSSA